MKKRIGIIILALLCFVQASGCSDAGWNKAGQEHSWNNEYNRGTDEEETEYNTEPPGDGDTLEVHFIDVGQGDATLIRQGEHAMLIDAGNNDKGITVQSYLQYLGVETLDYVIGTHPDSDHVGGLDVILYKFSWETVFLPDLEKDTRTYQDVLQVIQDKNKSITYPIAGEAYELGSARFTVVAPVSENYGDNWNDYSIGILLEFGENRFLFTGDAEEDAEQDMLSSGMDLSADVFKAAHHGSDTANTMEFLEAVHPEVVVISCGEGNSYGHPRAGAMNNFRALGVQLYRTDEQGTIVAYSDGRSITWNSAPSDSWKAGEPTGSSSDNGSSYESQFNYDDGDWSEAGGWNGSELWEDNRIEEKEEAGEQSNNISQTYVINTNSGKFHLPTCSSVQQMNAENREDSQLSRAELIEVGYEPCGRCNP